MNLQKQIRNQRILDLYLACRTKDDIAKDVGLSERQIIRIIDDIMAKLPECHEPPESLQYTSHWDFDGCDPFIVPNTLVGCLY
jgi:hypothetical protein